MAESSLPHGDGECVAAGSEVTFGLVCYPCDNSGEIKEAEGYCTDCREHMCATCLIYHAKMSLTKHHVLVDKDNMPGKQGPSMFSDVCTQRCQIHPDKVIEYYCSAHKTLGCGVCMVSTHDTCKGKLHIPDESKHLEGSTEFDDFQATMTSLKNKSENMIKSAENIIRYSDACLQRVLSDIELFRQEINDALDELKWSLQKQAEEIVAQDKATMTAVVDEAYKVKAELQSLSSEINTLLRKKKHCQVFIEMKSSETKLENLNQQLKKAETDRLTGFIFKPSEDLQKLLRRKDALGELHVKNQKEMRVTHVTKINVKSRGDAKTCRLMGATLLSKEKLVLTDWDNAMVKLIDTKRKRIVSEYKPETTPSDVTTINSTKVAITLPDAQKIVFLDAEYTLGFDRDIHVNQPCYGIACTEDKLAVSFKSDPRSIQLLSMTGDMLHTFPTSNSMEPSFSRVPNLTVCSFSNSIYASDWGDNNRLLMLDLDGHVMAEYKNDDLQNPVYTAVDNLGMVYVCGFNSHNIYMLTPDCEKVKVLLTERDGIKCPLSACYCVDTGRLYVSMADNDNVKIFQLA